jgi:hypothetical protein
VTYSARTQKAMKLRTDRPFQQFGQTDDESTRNGANGCTHTVLQYLALLWRGRWYSQDQVSSLAGFPGGNRGLYPSEVQRFCDRAGIPYRVTHNLTALSVLKLSERGPVGFGHAYSHWPEWYGFRYGTIIADGRPNGYAGPLRAAGKTQLSGFTGAHFGLVLGWDPSKTVTTRRVVAWEPNHDSPARPENPPYDQMTSGQFRIVYESYERVLRRTPYALVPTRNLP